MALERSKELDEPDDQGSTRQQYARKRGRAAVPLVIIFVYFRSPIIACRKIKTK